MFNTTYDSIGDVLYISLKTAMATNSVERDGVVFRFLHEELIGITILDYSQLQKKK